LPAPSPVVTPTTPTTTVDCAPTGSIVREVWTNVSGDRISDIPFNTAPNLTEQITTFETPTNYGDNYGTRVWIAADNDGELWLSSDDNAANKVSIAHVSGFTDSREWNKFSSQRSALYYLEAGQRYYIEALQKEGHGEDNLASRINGYSNCRPTKWW